MKVFLSWSGDKSRKLAEQFFNWLPLFFSDMVPYYSPVGIDKGKKWIDIISKELEDSDFGLLFLTKENLVEPWIHFEAGALSKNKHFSKVCPIIFENEFDDCPEPFKIFQMTKYSKDDIRSLLDSLNISLNNPHTKQRIDQLFEKLWDDLDRNISTIIGTDINTESFSIKDISKKIDELAMKIEIIQSVITKEQDTIKDEIFPIKDIYDLLSQLNNRFLSIQSENNKPQYQIEAYLTDIEKKNNKVDESLGQKDAILVDMNSQLQQISKLFRTLQETNICPYQKEIDHFIMQNATILGYLENPKKI